MCWAVLGDYGRVALIGCAWGWLVLEPDEVGELGHNVPFLNPSNTTHPHAHPISATRP